MQDQANVLKYLGSKIIEPLLVEMRAGYPEALKQVM